MIRIIVFVLVVLSATASVHAGSYQRTKDGYAHVWNNYPRPGDEAMWSGGRDTNGYATGFGTLAWYKKGTFVSKYTGTMVKGKFEGTVSNVDASGARYVGTFIAGSKTADWGPVTSSNTASGQSQADSTRVKSIVGTWLSKRGGTFVFNSDGTGTGVNDKNTGTWTQSGNMVHYQDLFGKLNNRYEMRLGANGDSLEGYWESDDGYNGTISLSRQ
jgi:hypothetical protein